MCVFNGFLSVWDQISVTIFARKDISWRVRKPNAKQNLFQIVTIFFYFFFSIFLGHYVTYIVCSRRFWQSSSSTDALLSWADPEGEDRGFGPPPPPLKNQKRVSRQYQISWKITKNRVSKQYWPRSPEKSQCYQSSIQCWAIIGPPASDITDPRMVVLQRVVFSKRYT